MFETLRNGPTITKCPQLVEIVKTANKKTFFKNLIVEPPQMWSENHAKQPKNLGTCNH